MGLSEKVIEALRSGILLNERVNTLIGKIDRIDTDMRKMNERLIRVETMIEMAMMQKGRKKTPLVE